MSEFERRRADQVATMADPDRLRILALVVSDPHGCVTLDRLAGPGGDRAAIAAHLDAMTRAGLLARTDRASVSTYHPTPDALVRFGAPSAGTRASASGQAIHGEPIHGEPATADRHRAQLARISDELATRFTTVFGRETVVRYVEESYGLLASRATVDQYVPALTSRFAADRLAALARADGLLARSVPEVLFVCVQNAGRSQIAAALLRTIAGDAISVRTAGSAPARAVDPGVVAELGRRGLTGLLEFPRPLTDEVVRAADVVVTMGCGDACPVLPGRRYLDWPVLDPAGRDPETVATIVEDISARVYALVRELVPPV